MGFAHITLSPQYHLLDVPDDVEEVEWAPLAVEFYQMAYNYYDKDAEELGILKENESRLKNTMPERFKEGVHLLAERAAFMGENIYVIDGEFDHDMHMVCGTCRGHIVHRQHQSWCVSCNDYRKAVSWMEDGPPANL